jgi:hypothetical protein
MAYTRLVFAKGRLFITLGYWEFFLFYLSAQSALDCALAVVFFSATLYFNKT